MLPLRQAGGRQVHESDLTDAELAGAALHAHVMLNHESAPYLASEPVKFELPSVMESPVAPTRLPSPTSGRNRELSSASVLVVIGCPASFTRETRSAYTLGDGTPVVTTNRLVSV